MTGPGRLLQLHGVIVDLLYNVEALPPSGGEAIVTGFEIAPGGGFNAMVAASRSGLPVSYGGAVGAGPFGDVVAGALAREGIETLLPRDPDHDQGCCAVMIEPSGERTFVASEGAEGHVRKTDLDKIDDSRFEWALLSGYQLYYPGSRDAFVGWLRERKPVPNLVFDPSPVIQAISAEAREAALARAAWISANEEEAAFLTGKPDPLEAAAALARNRPEGGGALVRLGARGCVVACGGRVTSVPGYKVDTVDTNGAGDAHTGAFAAAMAHGASPEAAAQYANVGAALSTTKHGPSTAPDRATIDEILRCQKAG